MECVEAVESECCVRPIECSWEPAGAQKLSALVDDPVRPTVTEIDGEVMDSGCVEYAESGGTYRWKRTWSAPMPELDTETKTLKGYRSEETAIPNL